MNGDNLTRAEWRRLSPRTKTLLRAQKLLSRSRAAVERAAVKVAEAQAETRKARELSWKASEMIAPLILPELEALS